MLRAGGLEDEIGIVAISWKRATASSGSTGQEPSATPAFERVKESGAGAHLLLDG